MILNFNNEYTESKVQIFAANEYNKALKLFEEALSVNSKNRYAKNGREKVVRLIEKHDQISEK